MSYHLEKQIKNLRTNLDVSLNSFAKRIGVSSGHLSNLENGKAKTIEIALLNKLQDNFNLLSSNEQNIDSFQQKLNIISHQLTLLNNQNPEAAAFITKNIENSLQYFLNENSSTNE